MAVEVSEQRPLIPGYFGPEYEGIESIKAPAEHLNVPSDQLIMLTQVRSGINPSFTDLKESIRKNGLQSEVSVARMNHTELEGYIEFVGRVWGANHDPNDFTPSADGYHYLVIAGHSRTKAIQELAEERGGDPYAVPCKVYPANSPEEIIAHQLDENIHSKVAPEREAIAIVESYYIGIDNKLWENQQEFIASKKNKFSRYALDRALVFAELPEGIRQFVLDGGLAYSVGIELGKAAKVVRRCYAEKYSITPEDCEEAVQDWLELAIVKINRPAGGDKPLSPSKAREFVAARASEFVASLALDRSAGNQTLFAMSIEEEARPQRKELYELIRALGEKPIRQHATVVRLHLGLRPDEEQQDLLTAITETGNRVIGYMGEVGLNGNGGR